MFTGLIEDVGSLVECRRLGKTAKLSVRTALPEAELAIGDSIAVNGACLTIESFGGGIVHFHCLEETLSRTNLGSVGRGGRLNLERALRFGDRLGGHIVSGHVDFCGKVLVAGRQGDDFALEISFPDEHRPCIVEKGSIAVNGVSLTIAAVERNAFRLALIPVTLGKTNLGDLAVGDSVNIETDMLGKYVAANLATCKKSEITMKTLLEAGF